MRRGAAALALALFVAGCGKDPAKLLEEGDAALEMGLVDAARERYKEVEEGYAEQFPQVYEKLGDTYATSGKTEAALGYWKVAVEKTKAGAKLWNKMGAYLLKAGQVEEAKAAFEKAMALDPKAHDALFNLGVMALTAKQHAESVAWFEKALAVKPDDPGILRHLGIALLQAKRPKEAALALYKSYKKDPKGTDGGELIGLLVSHDLFAEAVEIGPAATQSSAEPAVLVDYAYALARTGKTQEAQRLYTALGQIPIPRELADHVKAGILGQWDKLSPPP
jgi:tetratricopeptide (TPR) repeat protein